MKMNLKFIFPLAILSLIAIVMYVSKIDPQTAATSLTLVTNENLKELTSDWPDNSRKAIDAMKAKYGQPDEMTATLVIWNDKGPWKKTVVYKEEVDHNFPMPHKDVMKQVINYKVPVDKFDEIAMYDGSVTCNRTKGEIAAMCDKEDMNFLALNLANDIIADNKDVKNAREFYARTVVEYMKGNKVPYTQGFQFTLPVGSTGDNDQVSDNIDIMEMLKATKEKIKERSTDSY